MINRVFQVIESTMVLGIVGMVVWFTVLKPGLEKGQEPRPPMVDMSNASVIYHGATPNLYQTQIKE